MRKLKYRKRKGKQQEQSDHKRREFIATDVSVDTDERTVTATITTSAVDRYGEVVVSGGADLENYLKNPIVLWVHDSYSLPIGRAIWLRKTKNKIMAKIQFAAKEINEFAEQVYQMYKEGFLKAFSIGFRPDPDNMRAPKPEEIEKYPAWAAARRVYLKWELLEFSAVPVPANPEALAKAIKNNEVEASDELIEQLGYEILEDDEGEEIHIAESEVVDTTEVLSSVTATTSVGTVTRFDVRQEIDVKEAFNAKAIKVINTNDILADEINRHKGKVYDS